MAMVSLREVVYELVSLIVNEQCLKICLPTALFWLKILWWQAGFRLAWLSKVQLLIALYCKLGVDFTDGMS